MDVHSGTLRRSRKEFYSRFKKQVELTERLVCMEREIVEKGVLGANKKGYSVEVTTDSSFYEQMLTSSSQRVFLLASSDNRPLRIDSLFPFAPSELVEIYESLKKTYLSSQ